MKPIPFMRILFRFFKPLIVFFAGLSVVTGLQAAIFEDDEARKAILDLRQRVETLRSEVQQTRQADKQEIAKENVGLGQGLLDLQRQLEQLRSELASMRGANEQLLKEISDLQRQQKDQLQTVQTTNERIARLEPSKVSLDGVEFLVDPAEKRDYETALAVFRKGDFLTAQTHFVSFLSRYASSGYAVSALFWLGNAQYATRDYKEALINFRALIARNPEHLRAPEAVLSIANCQLELKDSKGARKSLVDLIKAYPQSEAAVAAKERLASLK